jgi:glycerophosphoryl diester phosphodiesterase
VSRLYAHRGAAAEQPENTIGSFERAVSYGVHGLEMDVHMSSDDVIVVSHDPDGQRMCGRPKAIKQCTYAELKTWDAGWGFVSPQRERPFAECGFQIPRFAEVLDGFPDHIINVDLKQNYPSMVAKVMKIVREAGAEDRVILASFSQATLLHVRGCGYPGMTAMAAVDLASALFLPRWLVGRMPLRGRAAQIPTRHGFYSLATEANISRLHALGVRVDFWTINEPQEARRLLAMGADGIMTDDPGAIAPVFAN